VRDAASARIEKEKEGELSALMLTAGGKSLLELAQQEAFAAY